MIFSRAHLLMLSLTVGGLSLGARAGEEGALVASVDSVEVDSLQGLENREVQKPLDEFEPVTPKELRGVEILDKVGNPIPTDIKLRDHAGQEVTLGDYLQDGKPALVVLGYYSCPTLCSAILNGTLDALKEVELSVGKDFNVVVVSIDPKESLEIARMKRDNYMKAYHREGADAGWHFTLARSPEDDGEVRRLADALGFEYRWDPKGQQWAHAGGIFFVTPEEQPAEGPGAREKTATLSRTLWGMTFRPRDVKFALIDASKGEVGSVVDRVLLSCFSYTPDSQRYSVYIFGVMRLAGIVTLVALGGALIFLWRRFERRKRKRR